MLVIVVFVGGVPMAVVNVVDVVAVRHGQVPALRTVLVRMVGRLVLVGLHAGEPLAQAAYA